MEIKTDAVEEPEQPLKSSVCFRFIEQEQQFFTQKGLKPFQCEICNRAFRLEVNLIRHHKIHSNQTELVRSPTPVHNSNTVNGSNSEIIKHLPGSSSADLVVLGVNVKTETQNDICSDDNGTLNQDADITSTENQNKTCPAIRKPQRIPTIHQCHSCSKGFLSLSKLQRHMMIHTGQRPFGCDICGKTFRQKTHLRVHYRTHAWSKYHKQRSLYIKRPPSGVSWFNTKMATDVPVQGMMGQKKDYLRNSDVSSVNHLDQAILMMNDQTKDNREPENTLTLQNAVVHVRKVSNVTVKKTQTVKSVQNPGNIQHKCFQCLKCFPSASKLQRHEMVHTGLRPFCCLICGKTFRQAPHLKTHERTHLTFKKRRLHICRICCKNFSSPYKLSRHLVTHSGIRPYRCILCNKTFTQKVTPKYLLLLLHSTNVQELSHI
uniref:C2H2-type domain-containing protein n=1 Tax=Amphiprion ocellaris TaxID=80972 RepID=A0A3Q1CLH3_AMPOC